MTSIATRFVTQIRQNVESWRSHEMDYVAFIESQQDLWTAVRAAGPGVEAEVVSTLYHSAAGGGTSNADGPRTVSLRVAGRRATAPRRTEPRACRQYRAMIVLIESSTFALRIAAADPHAPCAAHRQLAALIYEMAADLERQSLRLGADWSVVADPEDRQLVLQLEGDHETALALELLESLITRYELIDAR